MFRRVENKVKRREVKKIPEKHMVSVVGGVGVGRVDTRTESLPGPLLTRSALSGKGESREVTGNHRQFFCFPSQQI